MRRGIKIKAKKTFFEEIVFLQDWEAQEALTILQEEGIEKVLSYLLQWDYGESPIEEVEEFPWGSSDEKVFLPHGYVITWNLPLEYISLGRIHNR